MSFQTQLVKLRKRANLKQLELAEKMDVKQYVISSWETSRSEPNIDQIIKLANILNVPTDYLLDNSIIKVESEEQFINMTKHFELDNEDDLSNQLIKLFKQLDEEKKKDLLQLVKSVTSLSN